MFSAVVPVVGPSRGNGWLVRWYRAAPMIVLVRAALGRLPVDTQAAVGRVAIGAVQKIARVDLNRGLVRRHLQ